MFHRTNLYDGIGCAWAGHTSVTSVNSSLFRVLELTSSENLGMEVPTGSKIQLETNLVQLCTFLLT